MSETVHYKGILTRVLPNEGETIQDIAKRILDHHNIEFDDCYDDYLECLQDNYYQGYVVLDDKIYEVEKKELDPDSSLFKAVLYSDGTIEFEVKYYNGGCGFGEAIDHAYDNIRIKNEN
jgi:hypothetical protein